MFINWASISIHIQLFFASNVFPGFIEIGYKLYSLKDDRIKPGISFTYFFVNHDPVL